jgi:hypothetical protein
MERYPFYTALTHLKDFHGIAMNPDDFETIAWHGWNHIGNKVTKLYKFSGIIENGYIDLPCNVENIEMVTTNEEDFLKPDNISVDNYAAHAVETFIEGRKGSTSPLYIPGKMVKYEKVDNTLYFKNMNGQPVNILYKGLVADEDGLPSLNYKELEAIVNYCAFIYLRKKGMMTKDQSLLQMSQLVQTEWKRSCDDARSPIYLDQNFMNELQDVQGSWDRKRFGKSYKAFK